MSDGMKLGDVLKVSVLSSALTSAVLFPIIKSNSAKKAYYQGKMEGYELSQMCNRMNQELEDMRHRIQTLERL